jgi:phospholipid transport system substrate-binding protein
MIKPIAVIAGLWLALATPAKAATTPLDYTRTILEQAKTIVGGNQSHNQKLAALSALFDAFLDTDAMAREALGQHWSSFTPAQQKKFLVLFRKLMQGAYMQDLLLFENSNFAYVGQQITADGAIVDTNIVTPRDKFDIKYTLRPAGDKWMATAITVEGISMTANYSNQFNRVLSRTSVDGLLAIMQSKFGTTNGET